MGGATGGAQGSYISIITWSMTSITYCRQQWKDLCTECKNIDELLELPDAPALGEQAPADDRKRGGGGGADRR
jgi:hypothetical protein